MPSHFLPETILRFGLFEVDLRTKELRKNGLKVRIQPKPFELLAAMLAQPGKLVTRAELQERLWPGDTVVDFEKGLGTAVGKLREALGDTGGNPRYVETLPKRGFRFIYPVHEVKTPVLAPEGGVETPVPQARVSYVWAAALALVASVVVLDLTDLLYQ